MCCCAPFVGHIPPMSLQNPKFPSKLNRTEMADEAELFCTSASKTVVFARLLVSVNDLHRGLSSSVLRVEQITQNPPLATAYRFESGHRHHVGASSVSLAPTYFIRQRALVPLRPLSGSDPLCWASIWFYFFGHISSVSPLVPSKKPLLQRRQGLFLCLQKSHYQNGERCGII